MLALLVFPLAVAQSLPSVDEPLKTGHRSEHDAAVVIGVEDYFRLPDVPHAARDARAVYDLLVYTQGVASDRVQLLDKDATREAMLAALERAAGQASDDGRVWVYFAGHGAASGTDGRRLWLGADALASVDSFEARGVGLDEVRERASAGGATAVVLADACYTGAGRGGGELVAGGRFAVPTWAAEPAAEVVEWSAAGANEVAMPLDAARHGAFTYLMVGALRGWADGELTGERDGRVTAEEAQLYVQSSLRALQITGQTPTLSALSSADVVLAEGAGLEEGPRWAVGGAERHDPAPTVVSLAPESMPSSAIGEAVAGPGDDGGQADGDMEGFLTGGYLMPREDRDRVLQELLAVQADFVAGPEVRAARAELEALGGPEARLSALVAFSGWEGPELTKRSATDRLGPVSHREPGKYGDTLFGEAVTTLGIHAYGVSLRSHVVELRAFPQVVPVLDRAGQSRVPLGLFGLRADEVVRLLGEPSFDARAGGQGYPSLRYQNVTVYLTSSEGYVHAVSVNYPDD